jgi:hypothetical protein
LPPTSPKYEVRGSVPLELINGLDELWEREKKQAHTEGRPSPDRSAMLEIVLRVGLKELLGSK